ncbi:MAG: restriction endonuclease subunit S [Nitrospira sp.]|nr:restriction endonuclease subunit S [Nitrospira sp.]
MNVWPRVRLDQCTEVVSGATPDTSESSYWDGDICWTTPKDLSGLDGAYISDTPRKITRRGLESCAALVLPPESVLLSSRAPIGHVAINTVPMATNQGFKSFIPDRHRVHSKFLYHWLRKNRLYLESLGNGATFKEVSKAIVAGIEVPLPPLAEQRRIAAILDKADELRAKRRAALAKLDSLTQSIFLDMFGDPVTNDRGWPSNTVGYFIAGFETGKNLVADDEDDDSDGLRVLKVSAVTSLRFRPEESKALPSGYVPPPSHFVRKGDLLFSRANTQELIGATALVEHAPAGLVLPDKLWRFLWHDEPRADPRFVHWLFRQPKLRFELGRRATGTSGSMKNISQEKVLDIRVGLPELPLQREFGRIAYAIDRLRQIGEAALSTINTVFISLQYRAFQGEL